MGGRSGMGRAAPGWMVVFDLDDTLYLERDFAFSGYRHLEQVVAAQSGVRGFGAACRTLFEAGVRRHVFDRACAELGLAAGPERIAQLVAGYRGHRPEIALCPDAARYLAQAPGPLGLITDGPETMQRNKISALGLQALIKHIRPTGAWGAGYGKPHPRAFREMEDKAPRGARLVYVADNPAKDFVTPRARGWAAVQILRPGAVHDPEPPGAGHAAHLRIQSLDELDPALAAWAA
ncbi:MAG: HAD family hydrolase [Rhodobacteraceae bacterium]|nr:HAD family hydrolase [Paracoccaceae bacterium]